MNWVFLITMTEENTLSQLTLDNLRLAKTSKGNIIIVIAYDFEEEKSIVGKFDLKTKKFTLGKVPMSYLYIYSLHKMEELTGEEHDSDGNNRGGLAYLMNVGIRIESSWGLFDWTKMTTSNNDDDTQTGNYHHVEVLKPKHLEQE